ncbi:MAG: TonB family protein [Terriglobales bacterium]
MQPPVQDEQISFLSQLQRDSWVPTFVVELPSWPRVFFGNLRDLLLGPFRRQAPMAVTSQPAPFWPDVFVNCRLPVAPFRQSVLYHAFIVVALWGFSRTWLMKPRVEPRNPFANFKTVYYPISEYLPPLVDNSDSEPAKVGQKGEPAYARQKIVSVPRLPDNSRQTIITPSPPTIHHDVALPNIVAWTPVPVPVPEAAVGNLPLKLNTPAIANPVAPPPEPVAAKVTPLPLPEVVAPSPDVARAQLTAPAVAHAAPVAPPPSVSADLKAPALSMPAVVAPPPDADRARSLGQLNIGTLQPTVAAPHLPVVEQRTMWIKSGAGQGGSARVTDAPPPALPASGGGGTANQAVGRIIALGVSPAMPRGPIEIPQGSRRGVFAVGPEGKPGAPATPDIHAGGKGPGGRGGNGASDSPLAGITVTPGPVNPGPVAVAGPMNSASAGLKAPVTVAPRNPLLAAMAPPRVADIARQTRPAPSQPQPQVEDGVFGTKKYYSMMLNMPNLTSRGGSWVIRFAELNVTHTSGELTAPVATVKVDPAYPAELMREGLEGVVVLYAIIRADGTVTAVRVLRGVDARLDSSASAALTKWQFRPATKNGAAIDLEAVIQIPFKAKASF